MYGQLGNGGHRDRDGLGLVPQLVALVCEKRINALHVAAGAAREDEDVVVGEDGHAGCVLDVGQSTRFLTVASSLSHPVQQETLGMGVMIGCLGGIVSMFWHFGSIFHLTCVFPRGFWHNMCCHVCIFNVPFSPIPTCMHTHIMHTQIISS